MQLLGLLVNEQGDGHSPGTLAGDTPVRTVLDHRLDAVLAPCRHPAALAVLGNAIFLDAFDLFQRTLAQPLLLHADEPLGGGTEDDRGLVTPAMRVGVVEHLVVQQGATLGQHLDHGRIGLEHVLAGKQLGIRQVDAVAAHRVGHFQTVLLTDHEVFLTVARGGVHGAGTGIQGDVITQHHRHVEAVEGVVEAQQLERRTLGIAQVVEFLDTGSVHHVLDQLGGQDQALGVVTLHLYQGVVQIGVHGDGAVGRQGPGGGGPDDGRERATAEVTFRAVELGCHCRLVDGLEAYVDGGGIFVVVLHFGFRQRGATVGTPVHRLGTLVQVTIGDNLGHGADDVGFGAKVHGQIGVFPVTQYAQADEVGLLRFDLGLGVFTALGAELGGGNLLPRLADHAFNLQLDGQTVAIPARHIGGVEAGEALGLDDDVFEDLVDRVTDVNAAVRVGRAIVQNERRLARFGAANGAVKILIVPTLEHVGFALGQIATHRKLGFRQIQGVFIVAHQSWVPFFSKRVLGKLNGGSPNQARAARASRSICSFKAVKEANFCSSRSLWRSSTLTC
ncbi:hypothetical protein D3C75_581100 [compost metagenome]